MNDKNKNQTGTVQPIASILNEMFGSFELEKQSLEFKLFKALQEFDDPIVRNQSNILSFKKGVLVLVVEHPIYSQHILLNKQKLISFIQQQVPTITIKNMLVKIGSILHPNPNHSMAYKESVTNNNLQSEGFQAKNRPTDGSPIKRDSRNQKSEMPKSKVNNKGISVNDKLMMEKQLDHIQDDRLRDIALRLLNQTHHTPIDKPE